jgi:hypothetical protein
MESVGPLSPPKQKNGAKGNGSIQVGERGRAKQHKQHPPVGDLRLIDKNKEWKN